MDMAARQGKKKVSKGHSTVLSAEMMTHTREKNEPMIQLGKFFFNLAQLVFGGIILTYLLEDKQDKALIMLLAVSAIILFLILGWLLIKRGNIIK